MDDCTDRMETCPRSKNIHGSIINGSVSDAPRQHEERDDYREGDARESVKQRHPGCTGKHKAKARGEA